MTIVSEIKAEGEPAVRRWALELDRAEPFRAAPDASELPRDAILALADRVRRWHEAQRPADVFMEIEPGVQLERRWLPFDEVLAMTLDGRITDAMTIIAIERLALKRTMAALADRP